MKKNIVIFLLYVMTANFAGAATIDLDNICKKGFFIKYCDDGNTQYTDEARIQTCLTQNESPGYSCEQCPGTGTTASKSFCKQDNGTWRCTLNFKKDCTIAIDRQDSTGWFKYTGISSKCTYRE